MTTHENVIAFPAAIAPESTIVNPELDGSLDAIRFQKGFDEASTYLETMPIAWARNYSTTVIADRRTYDFDDGSYARGYRAALYGYLRQTKKR